MRIIGKGGHASKAVVGHFRHNANRHAEALFDAGADILTGGNHTFRRREFYGMLDEDAIASSRP